MREAVCRGLARACYLLALLLTIVLVRAVLTDAFGFVGDSWWGDGNADQGGSSAAFQIKGDAAAPVFPGVAVPIVLEFTNPHQQPMTVSHLRVSIRELRTPNADRDHPCTLNDYVLYQVSSAATMIVPPGTTAGFEKLGVPRREWPRIGMLNRPVDQDGCRGARLTLGYTAFGALGG